MRLKVRSRYSLGGWDAGRVSETRPKYHAVLIKDEAVVRVGGGCVFVISHTAFRFASVSVFRTPSQVIPQHVPKIFHVFIRSSRLVSGFVDV